MKVIAVTREYFDTEDDRVYFFEPLEKDLSVADLQRILDTSQKIVEGLQDERR